MEKRKALGRGLDALISETEVPVSEAGGKIESVAYVAINDIVPNKYQPREIFNQEKLDALISSIKEKGVVQPLLVRRIGEKLELIAGERRLRAMKSIGIEKAPVILREVDDLGAIEIALIENLQREGLNSIEEAHSYQRLIDKFNFTQEKIAQVIGKDRSSITNILRLLNLPLEIQKYLANGAISYGHARAILAIKGLQQQLNLCAKIINKGLSVRETERLASPPQHKRKKGSKAKTDENIIKQEEILQHALATKVRIQYGGKRGKIVIEYYSPQDLDRIIAKINT